MKKVPPGLWAALAAVWAFRAWLAFVNPGDNLPSGPPSEYETLARMLVEHGTFGYAPGEPTAFRLPFYPLLLALVRLVAGGEWLRWGAIVLHGACSSAAAALVYFLARRYARPAVATAAAVLVAVNPPLGQLDWNVGPEPVFTLLVAVMAWTLARLYEEPEPPARWLWAGLAIGASLLVRSTFVALPVLLAALLPLLLPGKAGWKKAALLAAAAYVCVVPWAARNFLLFGRIIPFEDGMGWHMLWQSSTSVEGVRPDENLPEPLRTYFFEKDARIGPESKRRALENILGDPVRYAVLCVKRLPVMWFRGGWAERTLKFDDSFGDYRARGDLLRAGAKAGFKFLEFCFLAAALWGMASAWFRAPPLRTAAIVILYMNIHVFTMGLPRYTWPVLPLLCLFAAWGASDLLGRARGPEPRP